MTERSTPQPQPGPTPGSARPGPVSASTSRRAVLRTAGLVALAGGGAATLGACAADAEVSAPAPSTSPVSSAPASSPPTPSASSAESSASATTPTGPSVPRADVPVGGGIILEDADYVVTQPSEGEFKAFSKICTHQGCPVAEVSDGAIRCRCHGSTFSIEDGSVTNPPASKPLASSAVTVEGATVYVTG